MKILIAVDGSCHSDNAVDTIIAEPWPASSECNVVTVSEPLHKYIDAGFGEMGRLALTAQQSLDTDIHTALNEVVQKLEAKFGKGKVLGNYYEGKPAAAIIEAARNWHADLVVIGSHGNSGYNDQTFGSVVTAVVNHVPCSVRIVHYIPSSCMEKKQEKGQGPQALLEETRCLVAINASANSRHIIDSILSRTWAPESSFQLISVVQEAKSVFHSRFYKDPKIDTAHKDLYAAEKAAAEKLVKEAATKIEAKAGKGKVTYHVLEGNVRSLILQVAQDWPADMIILGAHDRDHSVLEHFLGSVAQAVINNADCSVEIVRAKG